MVVQVRQKSARRSRGEGQRADQIALGATVADGAHFGVSRKNWPALGSQVTCSANTRGTETRSVARDDQRGLDKRLTSTILLWTALSARTSMPWLILRTSRPKEESSVAVDRAYQERGHLLVHDREGCVAEFDERHEVHDRRQRPLPSRLVRRRQQLHLVRSPERDQDLDRPLGIVWKESKGRAK